MPAALPTIDPAAISAYPPPGTPHVGRFVAYARVSTQAQGRSGLGLEAQQKIVLDYLNGGDHKLLKQFVEIESGKRADRPELAKALRYAKAQRATLLIAKLDRLARDLHFISGLMKSGVKFVACDIPEANNFTIHIFAAMAEYEGKRISERTKDALAAAKARGVKLGKPASREKLREIGAKGRPAAVAQIKRKADERAENLRDVIEDLRAEGIVSLEAISAALNERGFPTQRKYKGKQAEWHAMSVRNLLRRLEAKPK